MPSAAEECLQLSGKYQGISHCLESGHPAFCISIGCALSPEECTAKESGTVFSTALATEFCMLCSQIDDANMIYLCNCNCELFFFQF